MTFTRLLTEVWPNHLPYDKNIQYLPFAIQFRYTLYR